MAIEEGEVICARVVRPWTAVIFRPTELFQIKWMSEDHKKGNFVTPSEVTGVSFGEVGGYLEIRAVMTGNLTFAAFSYPPACSSNRYLSTLPSDDFTLADIFREVDEGKNAKMCMWYPSFPYFLTNVADGAEKGISVCKSATDCRPAKVDSDGHLAVDATEFLEFEYGSDAEHFGLRAREVPEYLKVSQRFSSSGKPSLIRFHHDVRNKHHLVNAQDDLGADDVLQNDVRQDHGLSEDDIRDIRKADKQFLDPVQNRGQERRYREKRTSSRMTVWIEVISIVSVILASVVLIVQCYICQRPHRNRRYDDSEDQLLGPHYENRVLRATPFGWQAPYGVGFQGFPQGVYPQQGYQMPAYGQTFPGVTFPTAPQGLPQGHLPQGQPPPAPPQQGSSPQREAIPVDAEPRPPA
jgi:hypothetical protein